MRLFSSISTGVFACSVAVLALMPGPAAAQYGPDTCRDGFVWREAFPGDHVCVRAWVRDRTSEENAVAPRRSYGDGSCVEGYVWREAYAGDHVCVSGESRDRAARDNYRAGYRWAY